MLKEKRNDYFIYDALHGRGGGDIRRILIMDVGNMIAQGTKESLKEEIFNERQFMIEVEDSKGLKLDDLGECIYGGEGDVYILTGRSIRSKNVGKAI